MASISANGSKGHHTFTLTVTETGTSTANNTSTISYSFTLAPIQSGWNWSGWGSYISYTVTINGTNYTGTIGSYDGSSTVKLKEGSGITVAHNDDGSKTMSFSFSVTDTSGQTYTCGNASNSGSMTLTKIARTPTAPTACSITANQGSYVGLGDTVTISWSGATGVITGYESQYRYDNGSWSSSTSRSGTSFTDTWNSTSYMAGRTIQYRVRTMNGSLASGWKESNTLTISGIMKAKVSNAWKTCSTWVKVNGSWKRAKRVWIKVNGTWRQT